MITLFHCLSARSFRPLWAMEELGIPYELKILSFPPRAHQRTYLEQNPLGTVPLFIDGETRMTESVAICQYVCERFGPTPLQIQPLEADFGAYLNYLHFGEATLTFPQTLVLRYQYFESPERRVPSVADDYTKWFLARLRSLEQHLVQHDYLCADRFTIADISVGYALMLATHLGLETKMTPAVAAYWARLKIRPGFLKAFESQQRAAREQGVSLTQSPDVRP